ncbi:hypothetical protein ITX31_15495 [Arthrobacter gandavensis]|uniref:hypothetical protein n=1 Tax=Arthrobacter gandavensis TaxID=169960 RepID=UPI00188FC063|nr:hypothetical protein [Arthrobacter gandavensis]MBF4995501.1 hypothetical protein [Arthrobacter gandavensis]
MESPLEAWSELNAAMLGGTAALVGLLILAISVNIEDILGVIAGAAFAWVVLIEVLR